MKAKKLQESDDYKNDSQLSESTKFSFDDDLRRCSASPIDHVIPNRYCYCGRIRSIYRNKLTNFNLNSDERLYEVNKLTNDVLELGKGAVYVTKKSLMLNQFLEFADTKTAKATDNGNRFNKGSAVNNDPFENNMCMVKVQENENSRSVCLTSSLFSDKRLVSLFRSVALYWFFCLNTVFAKGEVFRRKALSYDCQSNSLSSFHSNELNLEISPIILDNFENIDDDFFWRVISSVALYDDDNEHDRSLLIPFAEHSKQKMYAEMLKKILTYVLHRVCRFLQHAENLAIPNIRSSSVISLNSMEREYSDHGIGLYSYINDWILRGSLFRNDFELEYEVGMNLYDDEIRIEEAQDSREDSDVDDETNDEEENQSNDSTDKYSASEDGSSISSDTEVTDYNSDVEGWADEEEELLEDEESDDETKSENETTSSLVSDQNCYFLPEGMFNIDENDYPQYNLWCSPLIIEEVLSQKPAFTEIPKQERDREANSFKPYSLWESSVAADDEQIPNFYFGEEFSVFSIPYHPSRNNQATQHSSTYSLWGSPNIIDFLPGIRCLQLAEEDSSINGSSSYDSVDVDRTRKSFEGAGSQLGENFFSRTKYLNFRPVMNGFVSFTDRGAFQYYKKPRSAFEYYKKPVTFEKPEQENNVAFVYENPISFFVESKPIIVVDETDKEANKVNKKAEKPIIYELNPEHFFKPIQPAFRVETDCPAIMERSASGAYFIQTKKYLNFKHESDDQRINKHDSFQPKFEVNTNDKACQTENFNRWNFDILYEDEMSFNGPKSVQKKFPDVQSPYNAAFFYTLEEVFNVLEKSDIGGMEMAPTHPNFGSLF